MITVKPGEYVFMEIWHENQSTMQSFTSTNPTNEQSRVKWLGLEQNETDCSVSGDKILTGTVTLDIEEFSFKCYWVNSLFSADEELRNTSLDLKHPRHKLYIYLHWS